MPGPGSRCALVTGASGGIRRAVAVAADLQSSRAVQALIARVESFGGGSLDVLADNAARFGGTLGDVPEDEFDRMYAVNVRAPFFSCWAR